MATGTAHGATRGTPAPQAARGPAIGGGSQPLLGSSGLSSGQHPHRHPGLNGGYNHLQGQRDGRQRRVQARAHRDQAIKEAAISPVSQVASWLSELTNDEAARQAILVSTTEEQQDSVADQLARGDYDAGLWRDLLAAEDASAASAREVQQLRAEVQQLRAEQRSAQERRHASEEAETARAREVQQLRVEVRAWQQLYPRELGYAWPQPLTQQQQRHHLRPQPTPRALPQQRLSGASAPPPQRRLSGASAPQINPRQLRLTKPGVRYLRATSAATQRRHGTTSSAPPPRQRPSTARQCATNASATTSAKAVLRLRRRLLRLRRQGR